MTDSRAVVCVKMKAYKVVPLLALFLSVSNRRLSCNNYLCLNLFKYEND